MSHKSCEYGAIDALPVADAGRVISLCLRLLHSGRYPAEVSELVARQAAQRGHNLPQAISTASEVRGRPHSSVITTAAHDMTGAACISLCSSAHVTTALVHCK